VKKGSEGRQGGNVEAIAGNKDKDTKKKDEKKETNENFD